jgi:acetate CoA/acetoacetate CoA-transferase alpha subunit
MKSVSVEEAVALIPNGASVMVGGFMGVGTPERLLDELVRQKKSALSLVCNDAAVPGKGVGKLFDGGQRWAGVAHDRHPHRAEPESTAADARETDD